MLYEVPQTSNPKYSHCCKKTPATASCVQVGVNEDILNKISFKNDGKTFDIFYLHKPSCWKPWFGQVRQSMLESNKLIYFSIERVIQFT